MPTTRDPRSQIPAQPLPSTIADGFSFAAAGDVIGPWRPQMPNADEGLRTVARILQNADASFANLEGSVFDLGSFDGWRAAENGGGYPLSDAVVARDLKAMGLDLVSRANNHATDWGPDGMLTTDRILDEAGIIHAGSGRNLSRARQPSFFETPKGRVALVAAASTFTPMSVAGAAGDHGAGRPGISALRTTPVTLVTREEMAVIEAVGRRQGGSGNFESRASVTGQRVTLAGEVFQAAEEPGLTYEMNPDDHFALLKAVRAAKQAADLVVFTIHAHETLSGDGDDPRPADFLPALFHDVVDAGADIVVTTGPHAVRGIEIYRGKPLFYGLASLFFELGGGHGPDPDYAASSGIDAAGMTPSEYFDALFDVPGDWYEGAVAVTDFTAGQVSEIRLHPLIMERRDGFRVEGSPRPAPPEAAHRILQRIARFSERFGTEVRIDSGIGVIRLKEQEGA